MLTGYWEDMPVPPVDTNYVRFITAVRAGTAVRPDFARGAALQQVLDAACISDAGGMCAVPVSPGEA